MSSAVIAALFPDHAAAERIRLRLSCGDTCFPTDRVHLTSAHEPGHAGLVPAQSDALKLQAYVHTLVDRPEEAPRVLSLSAGVQGGHAAIAVFPRGAIETRRALEVLRQGKPLELYEHDLDKQSLEHAASEDSEPLVANVVDAVAGKSSRS
jgi:hypothetical protein